MSVSPHHSRQCACPPPPARFHTPARVAVLVSGALLLAGGVARAQTWSVVDTVKVSDNSGNMCGVCPGQSGTRTDGKSFTIPPGPAITLSSSVDAYNSIINVADAGSYLCNGAPPPMAWCNDRSRGKSSSALGTSTWIGHHLLDANSSQEGDGDALAKSAAKGVITVRWGDNPNGTAIPAGTKAKFEVHGYLSATCGDAWTFAEAYMDAAVSLTPVRRGDGSFPPGVAGLDTTITVACTSTVNGPFTLKEPFDNGLRVGDKYSFQLTWASRVQARGFTNFALNASSITDFQNTATLDAESNQATPVTFDFGVPGGSSIPTLSWWGTFILTLLIAVTAAWFLFRARRGKALSPIS